MRTEANMTQIIEWLNQYNINAAKATGTVAILILASILTPTTKG